MCLSPYVIQEALLRPRLLNRSLFGGTIPDAFGTFGRLLLSTPLLALTGKLLSDSGTVPAWSSDVSWTGLGSQPPPRVLRPGTPSKCPGLLAWRLCSSLQTRFPTSPSDSLAWREEKTPQAWVTLGHSLLSCSEEGDYPRGESCSQTAFWLLLELMVALKIKYDVSFILVELAFTDVPSA